MLTRLPLVGIDKNVFQGLNALQQLRVIRCGLVNPPPLNHIRSTITSLTMSQNAILYIPNGYFEGCIKLEILGLSYNMMTNFPNLSAVASTLTDIYMSYNQIISLKSPSEIYFPFLNTLHLDHNNISAINGYILENMPSLVILKLEYNHLVQIPDFRLNLYHRFKRPLVVSLEGNPWNCGVNILWIWNGIDYKMYFRFNINNITLRLLDVFRMKCHSPSHMKGLSFWDISKY